MAFNDLTAEQRAVLSEYVRLLRAWTGEQARTNNHAAALNSGYAQVQGILGALQSDDEVLDGSGLAGANHSLTKAMYTPMLTFSTNLLAPFCWYWHCSSHRSLPMLKPPLI